MRRVFRLPWQLTATHGRVGLALSILMLLAGCASEPAKPANPHADKASPAHQAAANAENTDEGAADADNSADTPAAANATDKALGFPPLARLPYEEVTIPTEQPGGVLYGRLYDPFQKPESESETADTASEEAEPAGPTVRYPLVILLHELNGRYGDWGELPALLVSKGYAVLALDMRGHGRSVWRHVSWRRFAAADWAKLPQDALRAARYFDTAEDYPQVDASRVALLGASLGANTAVLAASRENARVKAVVTLSAGLNYKGLQITQPMYAFKNAILMIASQDDPQAFEDTNMLYRLASGPKELLLFRNVGHGADMLRFYPALMKPLADWLARALPPTPLPIPPPPPDAGESEGDA